MVSNPGLGIERSLDLVVKAGRETAESIKLGKGRLNIDVQPWADVWVDGKAVGQTPLSHEVWEGEHRIKLTGPGGHKTVERRVVAGEVAIVSERLP